MKLYHAAALALVGWTLIFPPMLRGEGTLQLAYTWSVFKAQATKTQQDHDPRLRPFKLGPNGRPVPPQ